MRAAACLLAAAAIALIVAAAAATPAVSDLTGAARQDRVAAPEHSAQAGADSLPAACSDRQRRGWHGETMPAGLSCGEAAGEYRWPRDGAVMVYVPPGHFVMGSADDDPEASADERPAHLVELPGFYIDQHEVSWQRYRRSGLPISEQPHSRLSEAQPPDWGILPGHPVVNVSWHDAVAYADWAGKRLPSEAEWEKAARGTDRRPFPWGADPPTPERAVWRGHPIAARSTAPVDCCQAGASPYGALNMAGNVYEWCLDVYERDYYQRSPNSAPVNLGEANPQGVARGANRVLRGGAFPLDVEDLRSAYRYRLNPRDRTPYIGFRTVLPGVEEEHER